MTVYRIHAHTVRTRTCFDSMLDPFTHGHLYSGLAGTYVRKSEDVLGVFTKIEYLQVVVGTPRRKRCAFRCFSVGGLTFMNI